MATNVPFLYVLLPLQLLPLQVLVAVMLGERKGNGGREFQF